MALSRQLFAFFALAALAAAIPILVIVAGRWRQAAIVQAEGGLKKAAEALRRWVSLSLPC